MAISAYPRVAVQGTTATNNPPNGQSLMLYNSTTQQYEPATSATFAGGGGGGDATAANQSTQITEAQNTNNLITASISNQSTQITEAQNTNNYLNDAGVSAASLLTLIYNVLKDIRSNQTNNTQSTQIFGDGNVAHVTTQNELVTKNNA